MGFLQPHVGYGCRHGACKVTAPLLVLVGGFSGSGKSTLAKNLFTLYPEALLIDSDHLRKEIFCVPTTQKLPPEAYAPEISRDVYAEMRLRTEKNIAAKKSVIISATFTLDISRREYRAIAEKNGARFIGLWLETADTATLRDRITARRNDASDAGTGVIDIQMEEYTPVDPASWARLDAGRPADEVFRMACEILKKPGAQPLHPE